jgi:predicted phosphoadenosine phosphosulfate sulfurtransferase
MNRIILSFSCGKDSIAMWLKLREEPGLEIVPVYYYIYPHFHDRELKYYEKFFNTEIIQIPSERYISYITNWCFNPPHRIGFIETLRLYDFDKDEMNAWLLEKYHADYVAVGIKKNDSLNRRMSKETDKKKFPVFDFTDQDVIDICKKYDCKLPRDYLIWGCTLDGYTAKWTIPFREKLPEEFAQAKKYLPLLEVDIQRYAHIKDRLPNYKRMDWRLKKYADLIMNYDTAVLSR